MLTHCELEDLNILSAKYIVTHISDCLDAMTKRPGHQAHLTNAIKYISSPRPEGQT